MSRQKHPFSKQIIDPVRQYATKERKLRPHPRPFAGNFSAVFPHEIRGFAAFAPRAAETLSPSVREPCFPAVLGSQPPQAAVPPAPFTQGALYGAAALSRPALAFCGGERYNHLL